MCLPPIWHVPSHCPPHMEMTNWKRYYSRLTQTTKQQNSQVVWFGHSFVICKGMYGWWHLHTHCPGSSFIFILAGLATKLFGHSPINQGSRLLKHISASWLKRTWLARLPPSMDGHTDSVCLPILCKTAQISLISWKSSDFKNCSPPLHSQPVQAKSLAKTDLCPKYGTLGRWASKGSYNWKISPLQVLHKGQLKLPLHGNICPSWLKMMILHIAPERKTTRIHSQSQKQYEMNSNWGRVRMKLDLNWGSCRSARTEARGPVVQLATKATQIER